MEKTLLVATALLVSTLLQAETIRQAQPIRIGELNSYRAFPSHLEPYRKGWMLARDEINEGGGVDGRRIVVVSRDDGASDTAASRMATQLASRDKVHVLMGGYTRTVSLALAEFAGRRRLPYIAVAPFTAESARGSNNRYTFRLRPSASMQAAMLVPDAARLRKSYWAIVYPNNAHDYAAVTVFKALLQKAQPNVQFVLEQAIPLGKIDAAGLIREIFEAQPQAIFSSLFGTDLRDFVLEGNAARLFRHVQVVNLLAGQPEELALLGDAAPEGWWVTGYPWKEIDYPPHQRFVEAYLKRWGEPPGASSVLGYTALLSVAQAVRRAKSSRPEKLVEGLEGLETLTPLGVVEWRKSDHQSTLGTFVGQLGKKGKPVAMVRWRFEPGAGHLPVEY